MCIFHIQRCMLPSNNVRRATTTTATATATTTTHVYTYCTLIVWWLKAQPNQAEDEVTRNETLLNVTFQTNAMRINFMWVMYYRIRADRCNTWIFDFKTYAELLHYTWWIWMECTITKVHFRMAIVGIKFSFFLLITISLSRIIGAGLENFLQWPALIWKLHLTMWLDWGHLHCKL